MAGLLLQNNGAGGSQGTTVTQGVGGNSGGASGNFWDVVSIGASEADTFDSTWQILPGDFAYKLTTFSTVAANYVSWTTSLGTLTTNQTLGGRIYFVTPGIPTSSVRLMQILTGSTILLSLYQESGTGTVSIHNSAGTLVGAGTANQLTANTLFRIEFSISGIGTAASGAFTVNVYNGSTATLQSPSYTGSGANFGTTAPDTVRFGVTTANGTISTSYFIASILLNDSGALPGPELAAAAPFWPGRMPLGA